VHATHTPSIHGGVLAALATAFRNCRALLGFFIEWRWHLSPFVSRPFLAIFLRMCAEKFFSHPASLLSIN
jgi:hypothetical protein